MTETSVRMGRRPGTSGAREAILAAAREQFAARGFQGATIRDIATRAGVDTALIRHYFGDKETLFASALELPATVSGRVLDALAGDQQGIGERLARAVLEIWEDPATRPSLVAVVASAAANPHAMERLRAAVASDFLRQALPFLPDDQPELRIALALSHLLGVAFARHVIATGPLATVDFETLVRSVSPAIARYLSEPVTR
jgi:AcrR family transcriptional regulator